MTPLSLASCLSAGDMAEEMKEPLLYAFPRHDSSHFKSMQGNFYILYMCTGHPKKFFLTENQLLCPSIVDFFRRTCVVGQRAPVAVKDEPAFLPRLDFAPHLDQVASARLLRDGQVEARVGAVARRLDVRPQVKVVLPHRQVARERPRLRTQSKKAVSQGAVRGNE